MQSGCNNGALWVEPRDPLAGWAAGNLIEASCSQESERPGTQASREAPGLCGSYPGSGMRSPQDSLLGPGEVDHHNTRSPSSDPRPGGHLGREHVPRRGVSTESPPHPSSHHLQYSIISKSFGKTLFTATPKPAIFPEQRLHPRRLTIRIQYSKKRGRGDASSQGWAPGAEKACASLAPAGGHHLEHSPSPLPGAW